MHTPFKLFKKNILTYKNALTFSFKTEMFQPSNPAIRIKTQFSQANCLYVASEMELRLIRNRTSETESTKSAVRNGLKPARTSETESSQRGRPKRNRLNLHSESDVRNGMKKIIIKLIFILKTYSQHLEVFILKS